MRHRRFAFASIAALAVAVAASAQSSTQSYTYDALGRLTAVITSGGQDNGHASSLCYDPAGNRTRYQSSLTGALAGCVTPAPTPTPIGNEPPTTVADSASIPCKSSGTTNLTANDSDPENNAPLVLQGITRTSGTSSTATVSSASSVSIVTGDKGTSYFTYTVADSLGATSTRQLTVYSTGPTLLCSGGGGTQ